MVIRAASFSDPLFLYKGENGQPTGPKFFLRMFHLLKSMAVEKNIKQWFCYSITLSVIVSWTVVYYEGLNFGKYENGTYDGLLGLIYNNKADVAVVPAPLETDHPPGKFGPVVYSADVYVYTILNPSTWQSIDFLSCLNIFDTAINSLIMLALISIGFLLVKHYKHRTLLVLLSNALTQSFSTVEALGFLPHLSMLIGILIVQALHGALYSTNSWIEIGPMKVDTLKDMVIQGKEPIFMKGGTVYLMFKNGFSKDAEKVWQKAKRVGLSKCVLDTNQVIPMVTRGKLGPEKAFISIEIFEALLGATVCQLNGKMFEEGFRFHVSKSVHNGLMAVLENPRLSYSDRQVLDKMFYDLFEMGFAQSFMRDYKRDPPINAGLASSKCRRELFKDKPLNEMEAEIKLTLAEVGQALTLFFAILLVLFTAFGIEFLRRP